MWPEGAIYLRLLGLTSEVWEFKAVCNVPGGCGLKFRVCAGSCQCVGVQSPAGVPVARAQGLLSEYCPSLNTPSLS